MESATVERILRDAAEQAIMPRFGHLSTGEIRQKSVGDFVTVADEAAEAYIRTAILKQHPRSVVIGEELVAADPTLLAALATEPHAWLVDPLDGTGNFVKGLPRFGVMATELRYGFAERAWILQPTTGRCYTAVRDAGAFLNGEPLEPRGSRPVLAVWEPFDGLHLPGLTTTRMLDSCAFDYPAIAEGKHRFLVHNGAKPWDHLPGMLLLSELGGFSGHCDGTPFVARPETSAVIVAAHDASDWEEFAAETLRFQRSHGIELEA